MACILGATPAAFAVESGVIDGPVTVTETTVVEPTPEPVTEPAPVPEPEPLAVEPPPPPPPPPVEPEPAPAPEPVTEPRMADAPPPPPDPPATNPEPVSVGTGSGTMVDARSETAAPNDVAIGADEQAEVAPTGGAGFLTSDRTAPVTSLAQVSTAPLLVTPISLRPGDGSPATGSALNSGTSSLFQVVPIVPLTAAPADRAHQTPNVPAPPHESSPVVVPLTLGGLLQPNGTGDDASRLAGLLAFVMGMLPFAPNDRVGVGPLPEVTIVLLGAMIAVLGFFSFPLRDRRRRGPTGFATLALRPG